MSVVGPTADAPQSAVTSARQHLFDPLKHPAPAPPSQQPKLLDRLREALSSRHYSRRTEQCYCHWVSASSSTIMCATPSRRRSAG